MNKKEFSQTIKLLVYVFSIPLASSSIILLSIGTHLQFGISGGVFSTIFLLLIPLFIQFILFIYMLLNGLKQWEFINGFSYLTFFSIFPYSLAWVLYNLNYNGQWMSCVCLLGIFGLIAILIGLTHLLIHPESNKSFTNYRDGLKQLHFCALMHFFAIFLSISYLAGFALAFHDRDLNHRALYMENLRFDDIQPIGNSSAKEEQTSSGATPNNNTSGNSKTEQNKSQEHLQNKQNEGCFYFNSDQTILEFLNDQDFDKEFKRWAGDHRTKDIALKHSNYKDFEKIVSNILKMELDKVPIIYIFGETDPYPPTNYSDNYQLSSVRASSVYLALTKRLSEEHYPLLRNIEWKIFAVSNDSGITGLFPERGARCAKLGDDKNSNARVVEIIVESITDSASKEKTFPKTKPMTVMDYMYFSLYTITTTGYGDIKPVTAFSKLICSIENIIEVFFLVIFVNVLISFKDFKTGQELAKINQKLTGIEGDENQIKKLQNP